ncbi:cyclin-dependent kinase-like 2 isoform X2 [Eurytemora carolleeae]|uniref:cyclin-dependent kinase-like 2 isoform X2 n=1 Tax=Eurytemora carolleeae TaxID=1294199 RepID=UPI000C7761A4|nr:cyclin-dependent kinase-like 2 isoform X2 [Eurytemora carolleeae]|eukprot:XP_023346233.1 cyclin-dependent kinase-like 2 isoform X2 [Eurytemora affinis]
MLTGDPLFPGDSDIDQIFHIVKSLGPLCLRHRELMSRNPAYNNININTNSSNQGLQNMFPTWSNQSLSFVSQCLQVDPAKRSPGDTLLSSSLFSQDGLNSWFVQEMSRRIVEEKGINPLLKKTPLQSNRNITNRPKDSNNSIDEKGFQAKIRRLSDHDTLFDDVLKKANMYSEKYSKPDRLSSREPSAQSQLRSPLSLPSPGYVASPGRTVRLPKDPLRELSVSENNERWRSPLDSKPEPTEKFGFLEKAFERAFQFEDGPSSLNLNSLNNSKKEADRLQSVGGKEKQKVWLPSVAGATGRGGLQVLGKKPTPSRSNVLEGRSQVQKEPVQQRRGRPNLPHV